MDMRHRLARMPSVLHRNVEGRRSVLFLDDGCNLSDRKPQVRRLGEADQGTRWSGRRLRSTAGRHGADRETKHGSHLLF